MTEQKNNITEGGLSAEGGVNPAEEGMTFWGHLEVLRWTILRIGIAVLVCMVGCFVALPRIFDSFILGPTDSDFFLYRWFARLSGGAGGGVGSDGGGALVDGGGAGSGGGALVDGGGALGGLPNFGGDFSVDIININVATQFTTHISTSLWMALVIAFPYIIYEVWKFIRPALFPNEKKKISMAFISGTGMFYLGCAVGYCIVFPLTFRFLTEYQLSSHIANQISLNSYIGNFLMMIFIMGVVFEIPLLAWVMSALGVINKGFLKKYRRHAVVVLLILAAVITPTGDPFTLMVVFLPLYLLYELSILVVRK